ncbi:hypothetical protein QQG55_43740 [Brugia pahangi]
MSIFSSACAFSANQNFCNKIFLSKFNRSIDISDTSFMQEYFQQRKITRGCHIDLYLLSVIWEKKQTVATMYVMLGVMHQNVGYSVMKTKSNLLVKIKYSTETALDIPISTLIENCSKDNNHRRKLSNGYCDLHLFFLFFPDVMKTQICY